MSERAIAGVARLGGWSPLNVLAVSRVVFPLAIFILLWMLARRMGLPDSLAAMAGGLATLASGHSALIPGAVSSDPLFPRYFLHDQSRRAPDAAAGRDAPTANRRVRTREDARAGHPRGGGVGRRAALCTGLLLEFRCRGRCGTPDFRRDAAHPPRLAVRIADRRRDRHCAG